MKKTVLILSWHPGSTSIQSAGGFKRLYEIIKRNSDPKIILDKYPSIYKDLENENLKVLEYGKLVNIRFLEKVTPLGYKLLDRLLSPVLIFFHYLFRIPGRYITYVPYSELPHLSFAACLIKFVSGSKLVFCNLNVNTIAADLWVNKIFHSYADLVMTISKDLQNNLKNSGINATKLNGVGFDNSMYTRHKKAEKKYDAIFVGRHIKEKGIFDLLEIWNILINKMHTDIKLVTIGDVPVYIENEINKKIEDYGLKKYFILKGNTDEEEKINYYFGSKICVFPSHQEGWGIVPLEALAAGLPTIVYDLEVYKESLGESRAIFKIPEGDINKFAEKVSDLMKDYKDFELIAKKAVEKSNWEGVAKEEFNIIYSV